MKKQGISLIVLVITIIVLAILAAAVIISINNTGLINSSQQTVLEEAYGNLTDLLSMKYADLKIAANITTTGSATPAGIVDAKTAGEKYHEAFTTAGFEGEALSAVGKTTYEKTNGSHTMKVEFTLSTDGVYSLTKSITTAEAK